MTCRHLARRVGSGPDGPRFRCSYGHGVVSAETCQACPDFAVRVDTLPRAQQDSRSASMFQRPDGSGIDVAGLYQGASCVLVLGGPSLLSLDLQLLGQRGVVVAAYNNQPAALPPPLRPHIWLHTDSTWKFHDALWRDPAILKFAPVRLWRQRTRRRVAGVWGDGPEAWRHAGVIGFERNTTFRPEAWLTEPTINRGNDLAASRRGPWPHVINTLFAALRLLIVLGFRRIVLVGADFSMSHGQPYAHGQRKSRGAVSACNGAFASMNRMLAALAPGIAAAGIRIENATPGGALNAFPRVDYRDAVGQIAGEFPERIDAEGWYEQ